MHSTDKIELRVLGLSYSQIQQGAYALILAEVDGPYRIPIVIGASEAQSIAIKMEGIATPRPLTHDLFASFAHSFGVTLKQVFIYKFEDGIFSSELTFSDGERQVVIDSRTSDAIAIAMRTHSPIFTTRAIVEETGFILEEEETDGDDSDETTMERPHTAVRAPEKPRPENMAVEELEKLLGQLIEQEEYEEAARIKEIIKTKKNT